MKVTKFSKEIIQVGEKLVALSTIYAIEPIGLCGVRGCGDIFYRFVIKTCLGQNGEVKVFGEEIPYYEVDSSEFHTIKEEEHPMFVDKKIELLVVRDDVVDLWSKYLQENQNG